jgi:hypothetical protein
MLAGGLLVVKSAARVSCGSATDRASYGGVGNRKVVDLTMKSIFESGGRGRPFWASVDWIVPGERWLQSVLRISFKASMSLAIHQRIP